MASTTDTSTESVTPKPRRAPKVLTLEQAAEQLSCTEDQVKDLILDFQLETVQPIGFRPIEFNASEVRRYLRDQERRRLEEERRMKLELEGGPNPPPIYLPPNTPHNKILSIPQIAERMGWSRQVVRDKIYSRRLKTVHPLRRGCEPSVWESELERYVKARQLHYKCKSNRKFRR